MKAAAKAGIRSAGTRQAGRAEIKAAPGRKTAGTARNAAGPADAVEAPLSLTEKAYAALEERIVTLQLPPGTAVSEASLSAMLGIGRTPIREALQRLARERLVVIVPQRGIFVSEINLKSQLRLLEVRRELERLMARCASRRANETELKRFGEIARELVQAAQTTDDTLFMRLDREFNLLTANAARNEFLANSMSLIQALSRRFWYMHYQQVGGLAETARLHAEVAEAIAQQDADRAALASDNLLDYMEKFTRATLDVSN
ncbi:MAG: GntR family transcriptional regulator [Paucimonas sp.]|nr:GntR family transcriptional regulator [Paucimonas sp.]